MSHPAPDAWKRLARAVADRRIELGKSQAEVAAHASLSLDTVQAVESARRTSYRPRTLRALERSLDWPPRMIEEILAGRVPLHVAASTGEPSVASLQADLHRQIAELRAQLDRRLGDRNRSAREALINGLEAIVEESIRRE